MTQIVEDYVSFETAKLLKDKGFPQEYDDYHALVYNEEDYENEYEVQRMVLETRIIKAGTLSSYPVGVPEPKCYCPTLQMAMKWLREVHDLYIQLEITTWPQKGYFVKIYLYKNRYNNFEEVPFVEHKESYEDACEVAIKYCLENLI